MSKNKKKTVVNLNRVPSVALPMELGVMHGSDYAEPLEMLFHDDEFKKRMEHRQRLYQSAERSGVNTYAVMKGIEQDDRIIADTILLMMMRLTLPRQSEHDVLFSDLWAQVPKEKQYLREKTAAKLNMVTFLADIIESKLVDIQQYLRQMFEGGDSQYSFKQLDGVVASLRQLSMFFGHTRDEANVEQQELFADYADSLEAYCDKRMKTYSEKLDALKKRQKKEKEHESKV